MTTSNTAAAFDCNPADYLDHNAIIGIARALADETMAHTDRTDYGAMAEEASRHALDIAFRTGYLAGLDAQAAK